MKKRSLRVSTLLRADLASIIPSLIEWDPLLCRHVVYIMGVELSADLSHGVIAVTFEGVSDPKIIKTLLHALTALIPSLKQRLAAVWSGRGVPDLRFVYDTRSSAQKEMQDLFQSISKDLS